MVVILSDGDSAPRSAMANSYKLEMCLCVNGEPSFCPASALVVAVITPYSPSRMDSLALSERDPGQAKNEAAFICALNHHHQSGNPPSNANSDDSLKKGTEDLSYMPQDDETIVVLLVL